MATRYLAKPALASGPSDLKKRHQIMEGARRLFLGQGFDATSMNSIALEAGVSKGTLYVYVKSKEELFEAIADRMPELGGKFYLAGPGRGIAGLKAYLEDRVTAGVLKPHDCEIAAAQFIESCLSLTYRPMLFNFAGPPEDARIENVVEMAVFSFLTAYKV